MWQPCLAVNYQPPAKSLLQDCVHVEERLQHFWVQTAGCLPSAALQGVPGIPPQSELPLELRSEPQSELFSAFQQAGMVLAGRLMLFA